MSEAPLGPPFDPEILNTLEKRIRPWSGDVWRIVLQGSDPLATNSRGARWNPPELEALYFSLDPLAAHAELDYLLERQPIPIRRKREVYRFGVSLARVLDLRAEHGLDRFGLGPRALIDDDWSIPQAIAIAAYKYLECSGVLAPSARFEAANLALFLGGMSGEDELSKPTPAPSGPVAE